jgi:hypothetical protein
MGAIVQSRQNELFPRAGSAGLSSLPSALYARAAGHRRHRPALRSGFRQREEEGGAFVEAAFGPGFAAVPADDFADERKAAARAFKFAFAVQALKYAKEAAGKFLIKPDAVITDVDDPALRFFAGTDLNFGRVTRACEFQGVAEKGATT